MDRDKLLNYCFGDSFAFFVVPPNLPGNGIAKDSLDSIVSLIAFNADCCPVLITEINNDSWENNAGLCFEADQQLRRQYGILPDTCLLPRLWALSLLGTLARIYRGELATRAITPPYQPQPDDYVAPIGFLEGEWNLDILSQEGFNKMKEIVMDITTTNAAL